MIKAFLLHTQDRRSLESQKFYSATKYSVHFTHWIIRYRLHLRFCEIENPNNSYNDEMIPLRIALPSVNELFF